MITTKLLEVFKQKKTIDRVMSLYRQTIADLAEIADEATRESVELNTKLDEIKTELSTKQAIVNDATALKAKMEELFTVQA